MSKHTLIFATAELLALCETVDEEWHLAHDALKRGDRDEVFRFLCAWQDAARAAIAKVEEGKAMTKYDLTPIEYIYRGHFIKRFVDHNDRFAWIVTDVPNGPEMYTGMGVDECMAEIDEVLDDPRQEGESAANAVPSGEKR